MFAADADYEVLDGMKAFVEVNYGSTQTKGPFEAHPFQSSSDLVADLLEPSIPTDNPFVPASLRALAIANGDDEITWWQRFAGLDARGSDNTRQSTRIAAGVRGDLDSLFGFGKDWSYEVSYVYGRTTLDGSTLGMVSLDALYNGLRVEAAPGGGYRCIDALARAQGCVPINPFDGYDAAEQKYLIRNGGVQSKSELQNGLAYLSGSVFELPAGPLQVAVGAEVRRSNAFEDYSTEINQGTTTGTQISDSDRTKFKTDEFFIEGKAPILRDMPFFNELNVEAAYRWSDGHSIGKYDTWKYGGDWSPVAGLRFRAMKNRAVRTPVLGEVTGIGETFGAIDDPCINYGASANATLKTNCAALGIPADYNPPLTVIQNVGGFEGGNPDLRPEKADTFTYGVVIQANSFDFMPEALRDLSITVDRFNVKIDGLINLIGRQNIAQQCYELSGSARDIFCSQLTRGTDPTVPGANYVLKTVNDQYQNVAKLEMSGVDLEVNYGLNLGDVFGGGDYGRLGINSIWTFYDKAKITPYPGADSVNLLGAAGGDTSNLAQGWLKKQSNTTFSWTGGKFRAAWTLRYIGKAKSAPADIFGEEAVVNIKAATYSDLSLRYAVTDQIEVYGGMNNVFDKKPPFFPSSESGTQALDTVPAYYDIFGRQAYMGVKMRF
jgi:outer membrane receptor protein involved in Fe transport